MDKSFQFGLSKKEDYFLVTPTSCMDEVDFDLVSHKVKDWKDEFFSDSNEIFKLAHQGSEVPLTVQ